MEYHLSAAACSIEALERLIEEVDPSAVLDCAANGSLRISTYLPAHNLHHVLLKLLPFIKLEDVVIQPSMCCGSCSG